jgi:S-adenosylmethionine synthetase
MEIKIGNTLEARDIQVVERKGAGHPDTLSDALAEELSRVYANYTLKEFGYILHNDFDKVGIIGGKSRVKFGEGSIIKPITLLLNYRASYSFGGSTIPVEDLIADAAKNFLLKRYPQLNDTDLKIMQNWNPSSSPGNVDSKKEGPRKYWFNPRGKEDLPELESLRANDSVVACSYAPYSIADRICLETENYLNSPEYKAKHKWSGSDIKLQVITHREDSAEVTICVPQIAKYVNSLEEYKENLEVIKQDIEKYVRENISDKIKLKVYLNTRDNFDLPELYLTAIGSSIESGDIGLVGRGNRINGLISSNHPISIEAPYGKNPVYHVGKIYSILSNKLAKSISELTNAYTEVYLMSQSGRPIKDPWKVVINNNKLKNNSERRDIVEINRMVKYALEGVEEITKGLVSGELDIINLRL